MSDMKQQHCGRCFECSHSRDAQRFHELLCTNAQALWDHGLPRRPGGTWSGIPVHKLFGCVYFEKKENNK